ncbi:hypothetical protein [Muricoccus roseus]|uniref:hypothetical protein n=1 Tax=Muricoccus roseus TaxID=198092 RepID=UPI001C316EF6|nr:hypothetical protein [Roseomonas rosea]
MAARLDRITRRAHTLSGLLEEDISIRAVDMPGAGDLTMRIYAAMAEGAGADLGADPGGAGRGSGTRGACWVGTGDGGHPPRHVQLLRPVPGLSRPPAPPIGSR